MSDGTSMGGPTDESSIILVSPLRSLYLPQWGIHCRIYNLSKNRWAWQIDSEIRWRIHRSISSLYLSLPWMLFDGYDFEVKPRSRREPLIEKGNHIGQISIHATLLTVSFSFLAPMLWRPREEYCCLCLMKITTFMTEKYICVYNIGR